MSPTIQGQIPFPTRKLRSSSVKKGDGPDVLGLPSPVRKTPSKRSPKKTPKSPTEALKNVSLNSPKSRLRLDSKFSPVKKSEEIPSPLRPVSLHKPDLSRYREARLALNEDSLPALVGRVKQMEAMSSFLLKGGKSLYVSGAPGTGKTACLTHLLETRFNKTYSNHIFVNCMTLKTASGIFSHIASELGAREEKDPKKSVERIITSGNKRKVLLVLDEIDQLESKSQEILYTIFEWPFLAGSNLTLVGIANALDLTDRILPRLKLRAGVCPEQLSFPAYSRQEIHDILTERLKGLNDENVESVIKPAAIKFLAGKIAALSGDVRKAMDVCRRAVELAELKARKQTLLSPENAPTPNVDVPQILKIVNEVYGSRVKSSLKENDGDLPLVQKLLVASLFLMTKDNKKEDSDTGKRTKKVCKEVPFSKLYRTYVNVCKRRNMAPISESECVSMTSLLDARGLITLRQTAKNKEPRLSRVSLRIDENEVEAALKDRTLLSDILNETSSIVA